MDYLLNDSTDAWFNMAFDEYCLERYPCDGAFFYLWRNSPSVIIGYNQNVWAEVDLDYIGSRGIRLARRVTGGGAVYHDLQNLNYTIVGRGVSPQPVVDALRSLGLDAVLSGRNDIFVGGRKVSGFARRLGSRREIIHGTLMYDVDIDEMSRALDAPGSKLHAKGVASVRSRVANIRDLLPGIASVGELASALTGIMGSGGRELGFGEERLDAVRRLSETKFSTWDWIYGRSAAAGLHGRMRLACGTVEAALDMDGGYIRQLSFGGDFIGRLPSEAIASRLRGVRYDRASILSALEGFDVSSVFDGTDAAGLAEFISSLRDPSE